MFYVPPAACQPNRPGACKADGSTPMQEQRVTRSRRRELSHMLLDRVDSLPAEAS
jgi:hypothetical protein